MGQFTRPRFGPSAPGHARPMDAFPTDNADVIPFAKRSARYLYRNGYAAAEVARALADELDVAPSTARDIAIEVHRSIAA